MAAVQDANVEGEPGKGRQSMVFVSQILEMMGPGRRKRRIEAVGAAVDIIRFALFLVGAHLHSGGR